MLLLAFANLKQDPFTASKQLITFFLINLTNFYHVVNYLLAHVLILFLITNNYRENSLYVFS